MIHIIRGRNSCVERANQIDLSLDTRDFIESCLPKGAQYKVHTHVAGQALIDVISKGDVIIRCGQEAVRGNKLLNNIRGYFDGFTMHTFDLQDAQDVRNIESKYVDDEGDDEGDAKDTAKTRWSDQKFWVRMDIAKACRRPTPQEFHTTLKPPFGSVIESL